MRIVSVEQMRALEQQTFEAGISPTELQWNAGSAVAEAITTRNPEPGLCTALVGTGNNGRDAWIASQQLIAAGWRARLYLCPGHAISDDELGSFQGLGGEAVWHREADPRGGVEAALRDASVAIDGLLGIGARGPAREPVAAVIRALNARRFGNGQLQVVAVDLPSGVDGDTGVAAGAAVRADVTVVLGGMKQGLLSSQGLTNAGELVPVDIGILDGPEDVPWLLTPQVANGWLPPRPPDAHKGTFGRLLVVAGSEQYVGAAYLVCAAAVRAGAGVVTLAGPPWLRDVVATRLPEATYLVLPAGGVQGDVEGSLEALLPRLNDFTALAIGPGLSTGGGVPKVVEQVLRRAAELRLPVVADADALNVLAKLPGWEGWIGDHVVMTPHLGELARLVGEPFSANGAPWAVAGSLAREWQITLVVKGPFTAIGSGEGVWVHAGPNPALATAGTGDVLTGLIGGLLARGLNPAQAARVGVVVHALAGATVGRGLAGGGLAASDLLPEIPTALAELVSQS